MLLHQHVALLLLASLLSLTALPGYAAKKEAPLEAGMVNPGYHEPPAWFKNSFLDLRDDVKDAAAKNKRVMLYFYQDGCPYCKKLLEDNFGQRSIAEKTQKYFDVVQINIWGDREVTDLKGATVTEKNFARDNRVMYTPTLVMLNEKGAQVMRINGYYAPHQFDAALDYVGQKKETELDFREYSKRLAPPAASGNLHANASYLKPPYRLDRAVKTSSKPLLVLFEQKQCAACDELHMDIFKRKESSALLRKFQVVLLDFWADTPVVTPEGKATTARDWAKSLQVNYAPTMAFFDGEGREVFRIDAYLRSFHVQSVLDYVASKAYLQQPEFQRYIDARANALREKGIKVDLMN